MQTTTSRTTELFTREQLGDAQYCLDAAMETGYCAQFMDTWAQRLIVALSNCPLPVRLNKQVKINRGPNIKCAGCGLAANSGWLPKDWVQIGVDLETGRLASWCVHCQQDGTVAPPSQKEKL